MEDETNKKGNPNLMILDEKTLTAIQLLKDVRKEIAEYRKQEGIANEATSSNATEINAYKAVEEVLPRMTITPMLSAQIERHKDNVSFSLKINELKKENNELKDEIKELKAELAISNAEKEKVKAEFAKVEYISRGLGFDKIPESIHPTIRQQIIARARIIEKLEGTIKEITKENESLKKEMEELKKNQKPSGSNSFQSNELLEYEALLDDDNDPLLSPTPESSLRLEPPGWRKRNLQADSEETAATASQESQKNNNDDEDGKKKKKLTER